MPATRNIHLVLRTTRHDNAMAMWEVVDECIREGVSAVVVLCDAQHPRKAAIESVFSQEYPDGNWIIVTLKERRQFSAAKGQIVLEASELFPPGFSVRRVSPNPDTH